ncbi:unnamed protein product [Camellia sinensis]
MLPKIVLKLREKKPKNMLEAFLNDDVDPASQLLVRYNGSEESLEFKKDDEDRPNQRHKKRAVSNQDRPPSITDTEPKEAYQMPLSDSDSK